MAGLDLLRAIAVVWVMLFHSFLVGGLGTDFEWLSHFGWVGVDIFFVLSGFLIGSQVLQPLQCGQSLQFAKFYERRAWRIIPAFAVVLVLYTCFPALREAPGLQAWWQFATFSMNLLIDYSRNQAFSHAWSLCVEEHFYLIFPMCAWWLAWRPSATRFLAICAALLAMGVALRTAVWMHDAAIDPPRNWFIEDIYYPTWMRLDGLLMGVVLATIRVFRPTLWARLQQRSTGCLLLGIVLFASALWLFRDRTGLWSNAVGWPLLSSGIAFVTLAAADCAGLLGKYRIHGVEWIAAVSYSLYLSHKLAFHAVNTLLGTALTGHRAIAFATYSVAVLLFGALLHYGVERPFLVMRNRRDRLRQAASPSPTITAQAA